MKILTKIASLLIVAIILCANSSTAFASNFSQKIIDDANLLTDEGKSSLASLIYDVSQSVKWDIVVYTNKNGISESDMANFSEDYFTKNNYGFGVNNDGVIMVIDMKSRQVWFATHGKALYYWTDKRIEETYQTTKELLGDYDYYNAIKSFITDNEEYLKRGPGEYIINEQGLQVNISGNLILEDGYPLDKAGKKVFSHIGDKLVYFFNHYLIFIVIGSFLVALLSAIFVKLNYYGFGKNNTFDTNKNCKLTLTRHDENLLDTKLSVTRMSSSSYLSGGSGGDGGTSTHSGSGGGSFGGGGGRF